MLAKYFTVLSLLAAVTAVTPPAHEEQGLTQNAPGCIWSGEPKVQLQLKYGVTAQAEDKSWGEEKKIDLFKDDSKEESFKLYKAQKADADGKTKTDGDAIATVSKSIIKPGKARLTISVRSRGQRKVQSLPANTMF
jgi:hypothetical protein